MSEFTSYFRDKYGFTPSMPSREIRMTDEERESLASVLEDFRQAILNGSIEDREMLNVALDLQSGGQLLIRMRHKRTGSQEN